MEKTTQKSRALLVIGGILAALATAILAFVLFADISRYRPRLEAMASRVLGLDVRIRGEMGIGVFPPVSLSLGDLHAERDGKDVLRVERMQVGLKVLPLLLGKVRFRRVEIVRPKISIQRTASGPFNAERYIYQPMRNARTALKGTFDHIDQVSVTGGTISYASASSAFRADVTEFDLAIRGITFQGNPEEDPFRNVSFTGTVKAANVTIGDTEAKDAAFVVTAKNGNYEFNPVTLAAFGGNGRGSGWVYLTESIPMIHVRYSLSEFRIEGLFAASGREHGLLEGTADLSANLFMKGRSADEMTGTMEGDLTVTGNDLAVVDFDPDGLISAKGGGKGIHLERMGALLLPSPAFGKAARGLSGTDLPAEKAGVKGTVGKFVSEWAVKNGVFEATDVAFATKGHRIALTGRIDPQEERFDDVTVALVDRRGCVKAGKAIGGTFDSPRIAEAIIGRKTPSAGKTPVETTARPGPEEECERYYAGSVPPPE